MQIRPEQLDAQLKKTLAPIYLLSSDEPFLLQEAADSVRNAAREQGFLERQLLQADNKFDWHSLLLETQNPSLFAEKKLLELRLPSAKPGDKGSKALQGYAANIPPDIVLLLVFGKLDANAMRSKWLKALDSNACICRLWPIAAQQLPRWINKRLQQRGLTADRDAVLLLAEKVEGNLLAAAQEVDKLALSVTEQRLSVDTVRQAIGDSARYSVFNLVDACLQGKAADAQRMLAGLRGEGVDALALLWVFAKEIRLLLAIHYAMQGGMSAQQAMQDSKVWKNRTPLVKSALQNFTSRQLEELLLMAGAIDQAAKGMRKANAWDELSALCASLSGRSLAQC
ncbi:MAG: DNA polymerase III subunit delta [Pseudomonadales bacterium]